MRWTSWGLALTALLAGDRSHFSTAHNRTLESRPPLVLTYVANAGVLVAAGNTKVLIDALFDRPNPAYRAPSAETIRRMVAGTAPFDGVGLALVTHNHPDHFDARVALRFLESRRDAVLVAPVDAVDAMRSVAADWARVAPRVVTIDGPVGHRLTRQLQGVRLTAMRTRHGSSETPPNVMFLVEANGWRLFHEGDSPGDVEEYRRFGLGGAPIDLALVHFWFPFEPNCARFLEDVLRPDHVALTHLPIDREGDIPKKAEAVRQRYNDLILLMPGMATRTFPGGASHRAPHTERPSGRQPGGAPSP
jgi:L-ascorbate metabolism protein UlaG (beta-lactamase superfamily)